jgi:hypothetical protein
LANSQPKQTSATLLLDRTHQSKLTVKLLRELDVSVETHRRHYLPDAADPDWIVDAAAKGWVIISGDKGIEYDGVNRQAVVASHAQVFLLTDTESRGAEWAASLVMARKKILRIALENRGPFYCTVEKGSDHHVRNLRFLGDGGPIDGFVPAGAPTTGGRTTSKRRRKVQELPEKIDQTEMDFPPSS